MESMSNIFLIKKCPGVRCIILENSETIYYEKVPRMEKIRNKYLTKL